MQSTKQKTVQCHIIFHTTNRTSHERMNETEVKNK